MSDILQKKQKCLLVEDSNINAMLFKLLFKGTDTLIDHAVDGSVGLEMLERNEYDCIIMDLQMPVMDGFEAIAAIRAREDEKANIPVLVVTASLTHEIREKCFASGFDGFLNKPFKTDELLATIHDLITQPRTNRRNPVNNGTKKTVELKNADKVENKITVDLAYLKTFSYGEKEFEKDMIESSVAEIEEKIEELSESISTAKTRKIKQSAHSLKSLASIVGVNDLHSLFNNIEDMSEVGSIETIQQKFNDAQKIWKMAHVQLTELLEREYSNIAA